jgi:hypothetical protein
MCAALGTKNRIIRPGKTVRVWRQGRKEGEFVWAGFARKETLGWWRKKGGEYVDVPAARFAERSDRDRQLRWDEIPPGMVVRGLVDPNDGKPLLKVVTRASTPGELARFEHPRMPLLETALYSAEPLADDAQEPTEANPDSLQGELF